LIPIQIQRILSILRKHDLRFLLMGGQACVLYGGAQFSRDIDIHILADEENLTRLRAALQELQAEVIAVPPFEQAYLDRGLAVHFRCHDSIAAKTRLDVMSVMRGMPPFEKLWDRRTTFEFSDGSSIDLLALSDLIQAKKTQRDKDWPMIRSLVEAHYACYWDDPQPPYVEFWFRESRTPSMLLELYNRFPSECQMLISARPLLEFARLGDEDPLAGALLQEQEAERKLDRAYWKPLLKELERLRFEQRKKPK
jgi:hypothetical protein